MPEAHARWSAERPFTFDEPFARVPMAKAVADGARSTKIPAWEAAVERRRARARRPARRRRLRRQHEGVVEELAAREGHRLGQLPQGLDEVRQRRRAPLRRLRVPLPSRSSPRTTRPRTASASIPVFIKDYPFETSPLARRNDARPDLVDRFELFVHGRELCNAFSELNDPDDQAERFRDQVRKKAAGAEETMDYDEDYIRALEHGMPPAAGFGMGIDRLTMMLTNAPSIRDVILFPLLRPESVDAATRHSPPRRVPSAPAWPLATTS